MKHVVDKPWGKEITFSEEDFYIGKILIVKKDKRLSYHFHEEKKETLFLLKGKIHCIIDDVDYIFEEGKTLRFDPETKHRIHALEESEIVEVSTMDEKSVRLEDDCHRKNDTC